MTAFIDESRDRFGVEPICRTLGVSASAYYHCKTGVRSARVLEDERLLGVIRQTHKDNYYAYGYRKMWKTLGRAGETAPDQLWIGDFTYLRCWEGPVFFSFVVDVFSRKVVGWQLASQMRTDLVLDALRMALGTRQPGADFTLITHSDAGSQYTSHDYTQVLTDHRVLGSIGTVGDAYDNAMAESFVDSFKTELIKDRVWQTRSQLELAIVEWVAWFNDRRLHEALGDIPPAEFEAAHHARQAAISGDRSVTVLAPNAANGLTTRRLGPVDADLAPGRLTPSDNDPHVQTAPAKTAPEVVVRRAPPPLVSPTR